MTVYSVVIPSSTIFVASFCNSDAILLELVLTMRKRSSISGYMRVTDIGADFHGWLIFWIQKVSSKLINLIFGALCTFYAECHFTMSSVSVKIQYSTRHAYPNLYVDTACSIMKDAQINLRSWASSNHKLTNLAEQDKVDDGNSTINVLGLQWDTQTDTLSLTCT